jgi:hypothetical protein
MPAGLVAAWAKERCFEGILKLNYCKAKVFINKLHH